MRRSHAPATCACNLECAEAVYTEPRGASTGKMAATGKRELLAAAAATALAASGAVVTAWYGRVHRKREKWVRCFEKGWVSRRETGCAYNTLVCELREEN